MDKLVEHYDRSGDISDESMSTDTKVAYKPWERQRAYIMWEISCAIITSDWNRVGRLLKLEQPKPWGEGGLYSGENRQGRKKKRSE